jgi:hypothetical protein
LLGFAVRGFEEEGNDYDSDGTKRQVDIKAPSPARTISESTT